MFKAFKYSILAGVALALVGCGTKIEVLPTIEETSKDQHIIYAKFDSNKTYMKKYLPSNVVIKDDAPISVEYSFANNATKSSVNDTNWAKLGDVFIGPLGFLIGGSVTAGQKSLYLGAQLKFFNQTNEIVFASLCKIAKSESGFSSSNLTELRGQCIPKIQQNLKDQINLKFNKGDFNVFK